LEKGAEGDGGLERPEVGGGEFKLLRRPGMSLAHEPEHRTTAGRPLSIDLAVVPLDLRIALKV
jgi:hypothetical protein